MKKYLVKTYTEKDSLVGEAMFDTMEEAAGHLEQRLSGHYGRRRQLDGERLVMGFRTAEQQMIDKEVSHGETAGEIQDEGYPDRQYVQEPEELLQDGQGD